MPGLRDTAQRWLDGGQAAVLVEVVEARGSVPRETGTRMLVGEHHVEGTIGGGHLEWKAIASARRLLEGATTPTRPSTRAAPPTDGSAPARAPPPPAQPARFTEHFPLGPALGQCCGGAVTLAYAPLDAAVLADWPRAAPRFELQLYGAGHVGRAIVRALAPFNVRITWIDEREDEFAAARLEPPGTGEAEVHTVCVDGVEAEVDQAAPGTFFLVLTHQHDLDLRITEAILRRADFGFLGLIGSKTKKQRFVNRFEQRGLSPRLLERLTCPIGVAGITGKEPEVLAAAVVAQLLQVSSERRAAPPQRTDQA